MNAFIVWSQATMKTCMDQLKLFDQKEVTVQPLLNDPIGIISSKYSAYLIYTHLTCVELAALRFCHAYSDITYSISTNPCIDWDNPPREK